MSGWVVNSGSFLFGFCAPQGRSVLGFNSVFISWYNGQGAHQRREVFRADCVPPHGWKLVGFVLDYGLLLTYKRIVFWIENAVYIQINIEFRPVKVVF